MGLKAYGRRLLGIALLLVTFAAAPAAARTILELDATRQPVPLQDWGDAWLDPSGAMPVEKVASDPNLGWAPTREGTVYPVTTGKVLWIRFTVPPAPDAERWYLEIPDPSVNRVTLYTPDSVGQWIPQAAGDRLPVAEWPVPHRHPLLPVVVSAEEPRKYLLRVENPRGFSAPLTFLSESRLSQSEQRTSLILGIYFGLAGLAAAVGAISAISLRDRAYAFYALSVTLMAIAQAAMTGIGGLHLWPHWPAWNDVSSMVLPVLAVGSLLWFYSAVVSLPERSRRLDRLMNVLALVSMPVALGILLVEPSLRSSLVVPYISLTSCVILAAVIWAARRGDPHAPALLGAMLPVAVAGAFPLARLLGLIPVSFWTLHGMQVGIAIEMPVVLVILMLRSQQRREHIRRIQGLERFDPATGLINARVFAERAARMMARSERLEHQSALLVIDIVNRDQIRRMFGERSAEELPLRVAGRLLGTARDIDAVARLSELRFGMILEGPVTSEDMASTGPRIVARCLMPFKNKPIEWVAQVRVAQTLVPTDGDDAQQVIDRLSALLNNVPPDSRRAVFTLAR